MGKLAFFDSAELRSWLVLPQAAAVRALSLSSADDGGSWIVHAIASAGLPALRSLTLDHCNVGDDGLAALVDTRLLGQLDELVIADETVTDAGIRAVVSSPAVVALTTLDLSRAAVDDDVCRAIGDSPYLTGLTRLEIDLASASITPAGLSALLGSAALAEPIKALVQAQAATRAEVIVAARKPLANVWTERLAQLCAAADPLIPVGLERRWPAHCRPALDVWLDRALTGRATPELRLARSLQPYRLRGSGRLAEDFDSLQVLMQHPDAINIRRLDLRYLQLDSSTLAYWLRHSSLSRLTALDLQGHRVTSRILDALADNPTATGLRVLAVGGQGEDAEDTAATVTAHGVMARLQALQFAGSVLGDSGARTLAQSPALRLLRGLDLRDTEIGADGVQALLTSGLPSVVRLDLSENPIGDDAAQAFAATDLSALSRLDLGYPRDGLAITDQGARILAEARLPQLTDLGLEFHAIADAGAVTLAARQGLRLLRISHGNRITRAGGEALIRAAAPHLRLDLGPGSSSALRDNPTVRASSLDGPSQNDATMDPFDS